MKILPKNAGERIRWCDWPITATMMLFGPCPTTTGSGQSRYPGWSVHMGKISSSVTKISVTGPARLLIWTHRNFCKEKSGEARSRKPSQPGRPGSYEEVLTNIFAGFDERSDWFWSFFFTFRWADDGRKYLNCCANTLRKSYSHPKVTS